MVGGISFYSGVNANLASVRVCGSNPQEAELSHLSREIEGLRREESPVRWEEQPHPGQAAP